MSGKRRGARLTLCCQRVHGLSNCRGIPKFRCGIRQRNLDKCRCIQLGWTESYAPSRRYPLRRRTALSLLATVSVGLLAAGGALMAAQASTTAPASSHPTKKVCGDLPRTPHQYACLAIMQTDTV